MTLSRRQLVSAGLGLAAAIQPGLRSLAAGSASQGANEIYARARGGAGDEPGIWWYSGRLWGRPIGVSATQLFAVEGLSFNRMLREPGGGLQQVMEECGFWSDPASGEVLDDWINPLNGLPCEAKHFRSRQAISFTADGVVDDDVPYRGRITGPVTSGSTLWISESLHLAFPDSKKEGQDPLTYGGPTRAATSLVTYTLDAEAALADDPGFVASTMNYQSVSSWYPWMRMGQAPGHIVFELFGRKLAGVHETPAKLRSILEERRAGFLENPNI